MKAYRGKHVSSAPWPVASSSSYRRGRHQKRNHRVRRWVIFCVVLAVILFFYPMLEAKILITEKKDLKADDLPAEANNLRIVYLSDIHYGYWFSDASLDRLLARINSLRPDLVLFGGDYAVDNQSALHLEVGESDFILDGKGEITDGLLSGNYLLCAGDEPIANIEVINYDAAAAEEGSFIGTYRITLASDDEEMAFFSAFGLTVNVNTSNVYGGTIALTLDSNGAPLATVTMTAGYGDGAEVLDIASAEPALDMIDGEAMAEYMSSIDIGAIIQSLLDAGVPEDFINGILGMMMGEEAYAGDDAA